MIQPPSSLSPYTVESIGLTAVRRLTRVTAIIVAALVLGAPPAFPQEAEPLSAPRAAASLTILQVNDVYSTVPVNGMGGLARVATIKRDLATAGRTPLLMIGGDFLSSSVASTVFKGEQMVAALNAAGLDIATLGNHEFDFGVDLLLTRMAQAKWQWVLSNVIDRQTGAPLGGAAPYLIRSYGGMTVGILGACIESEGILPHIRERVEIVDPFVAIGRYLPELKRQGANVIVLLTHLNFATDRALATRFPEIDVIVGGHEHYPIVAFSGRTLISKAGMDARFVARIDLDKTGDAPLDRFYELIPVTSAVKDDPATAEVVNEWEGRLGTEMNTSLGTTRAPLDAVEPGIRAGETNLGDFLADAMRRQVGADVGILNSGGIRGNRLYPAGSVSRRTLLEIHPFSNVICKIEVTGRVLLEALNMGVSKLPAANGAFPQVSGMTMRVNVAAPSGARVQEVKVDGGLLDLDKIYTLALPDFVLDGGDGYTMFGASRVLIDKSSGTLIIDAVERAIAERGVIDPQVDGRISIVR
jgi:2',3'-cyclic-nucleotide 2'-phosphodiesterase (5'-nucleotidase family)